MCCSALGQQAEPAQPQPAPTTGTKANSNSSIESDIAIRKLPSNLWQDQKRIWTAPVRLRTNDLKWMVPIAFGTALAFGVDDRVQRHFADPSNTIKHANTFSNAGAAAFAGVVATQYLWGIRSHDDHLKESGFLAGEAAIDSLLLTELAKGISRRERPTEGTGQGRFFQSNSAFSSGFPSQHAAAAWSIATVIAHEYPGIFTKIVAYGGATAIGAARIAGESHFTSDVFIGSALGYFVGREVYRGHSKDEKLDRLYGTFEKTPKEVERDPSMMGSAYVPLESWVYPVIDRIRALGYGGRSIQGMRPWTRKQCARFIDDLEGNGELDDANITEMVGALREEFAFELSLFQGAPNVAAKLDSVYTRLEGVSGGEPVTDSVHFGQTLFNDYGRPYQRGFNAVSGGSGSANAGPFVFYVRGEYQHAPGGPGYSLDARNAIAIQDYFSPLMPPTGPSAVDRLRLLDAYVGLNVKDWQLSFGKQSLWWGPGEGTDLLLSDNAEPMTMFRLSRVAPLRLPSVLGLLGNIGSTTFLGQIGGYHFLRLGPTFQLVGSFDTVVNPQPYVWGQKLSFQPTENLEFGVSITTVFAGLGRPATLSTFRHTFSHSGNLQDVEPGDRRTGFDFSYRIPGLRRWLTLYSGSMSEDEPNPIAYPRRSSMSPGIYLTHFPKFEKLDLRVESVYTDLPNLQGVGAYYTNRHYAGGYTNQGVIMGSWIGKEGRGLQVKSNYWFAAQKKLTLSFRSERVNPDYLSGGTIRDFGANYDFKGPKGFWITAGVQYEHWTFPLLSATAQSNVVTTFGLKWEPTSGAGIIRRK